jgi:tRNA U34 5-methylaminomethyl-2-thiouridine-forming methyltransferase MnmC
MKSPHKLELRKTGDGSTTLFNAMFGETYHSEQGALSESRHVYIKNGLEPILYGRKSIRIFEMGFGTACNTILSFELSQKHPTIQFYYETLEIKPLEFSLANSLDFDLDRLDGLRDVFLEMHRCPWNEEISLSSNFSLKKIKGDICRLFETEVPVSGNFDLVFFDAFGPSKQADVWNCSVLEQMTDIMKRPSVLVTFCAQGEFKRNLRKLGFSAAHPAGFGSKREITVASLTQ